MHNSIINWSIPRIDAHSNLIAGHRVLEVGSYIVNGTLQPDVLRHLPSMFIGLDQRPGPGVSWVCPAEKMAEQFPAGYFHCIISTSTLEHVQDWRGAVNAMKTVLAVGGFLLLTTVAPGFPLHEYPADYWRFTKENLQEIFADFSEVETGGESTDAFICGIKSRVNQRLDLSQIKIHSMENK